MRTSPTMRRNGPNQRSWTVCIPIHGKCARPSGPKAPSKRQESGSQGRDTPRKPRPARSCSAFFGRRKEPSTTGKRLNTGNRLILDQPDGLDDEGVGFGRNALHR